MADDFGFVADKHDEFGFTPDESPSTPKKDIGMLDSALAGAEEGLTMKFADELGGAFGAGLEGISNAIDQKSLKPLSDNNLERLYTEYRDFNRKRLKDAEEANPKSNFIGNVAGGLLIPVGAAGQLGKEATTGAKALSGLKIGAGMGALGGAGASNAKMTSPEFAKDVAIGTGVGGVLGGTLPVAADYAIKPIAEATGDALKWVGGKVAGPITDAYKLGKEGLNAVTTGGQKSIMKQVGDFAGSVAPEIQGQIQQLAALKSQLIKEAEEAGYKIDPYEIDKLLESRLGTEGKSNLPEVTRELEQYRELLRSAKEGKLVSKQKQIEMPTGQEKVRRIEELKKAEQSAIDSGVDPADIETVYEDVDVPGQMAAVVRQKLYKTNPETGEILDNGYKKLASKLVQQDEIPNFKTVTDKVRSGDKDLSSPEQMLQLYNDLKQKSQFGDMGFKTNEAKNAVGGTIKEIQNLLRHGNVAGEEIGSGIPLLKETDKGIHGYNQATEALGIANSADINEAQIRDKIISMIGQEGKVGTGAIKAQERIDDFLGKLEQVNKPMADRLRSEFSEFGNKISTIQEINKPLSLLSLASPLSITRTLGAGAANVAGYQMGKAQRGIQKIGESGVAKISEMTPQFLKQMGSHLSQSAKPAEQELSRILLNVADKDDRARNATLGVMLQSPAYRKMLGMSDVNEEEVK